MKDHNQKINVLLVNDHLGWDGFVMHGVGRLFLQWIPLFNKDEYNVIVCILRKEDALSKYFEEKGIKIWFLGKGKFNPFTLFTFIKIIRQEKINVMHVQGFGSTTFGRLARMLTGVPIIVHFHDTSHYYPWIQRIADALLARFTDVAIAVSNSVKQFNIDNKRVRGMNPNKIIVMYNCVSLRDFNILDSSQIVAEKIRLGVTPDSKIVGTVTRLYEPKGNKYLLEAAVAILKVLPKTVFLIVGDGPLRKDLEELSKYLEIDNHVIFTGFCDNVLIKLSTFDVKVLASYEAEGTPVAVLEAMALGKPIVSTNIIEIIKDGITGLLVPPKNPKILAQKIISLLMDQDFAEKLGSNAKNESMKYDVNIYVRKLEMIYNNLIREPIDKNEI